MSDFLVVKLDGTSGAELWRQNIENNIDDLGILDDPDPTGVEDVANAVAVDGAGNVIAAGVIWHRNPSSPAEWSNILVVKLDGATGAELWRQVIPGSDQDPADLENVANAIALDGAGNMVVGGRINYFSAVLKLDGASGAELWRKFIHGSAGGRTSVYAVALDGAGNVVTACTTHNVETPGSGPDFTVVKLDGASGMELWRVIPGAVVNAITVDGAGNVGVAGSTGTAETGPDFAVIKFDGTSGVELWRQVISHSASGPEAANAVAVDGAGNIVTAGVTGGTGSSTDFTVVKFSGADGTELWQQVINGTANDSLDQALAVTVDGAGNVVAAGVTQNILDSTTSLDFTVAKIDGGSGTEQWRQVIGSASGTAGQARAVLVDGAGNVIASGAVSGIATVAKFRGTDGSDFTPPDTEPPTVTITSPANSAIVSGTITVSAEASDNMGVAGVQFQLDGAPLGAEDTEAPYAVSWDTSTTTIGQHSLTAVARDAAGNHGTAAPVTVIVANLPSIGILP